ncbi:MAG: CehA/McbA family metallohydrolase [Deltaproteobacteria bacterium]|nr:CehA/McbA family metallohydrolase [Deltaproteobacteria bacterium]
MSSHPSSRSAWSRAALFAFLPLALSAAACDDGNAEPADAADADSSAEADDSAEADAGPDPFQCEPRATPLALDEIPSEGEAVAGHVTAEAELLGSEVPMAQAGVAWKLANHDVAFVVQGNEVRVGYDMYGGSLLDADLQRPAGQPGNDTFREQFSIVGWKVGGADSVTVLCDGNGGRPAVLRIEGRDEPSLILPPIDALNPRPLNFRIVTDYILEPDSQLLRIRTSATNESSRTWSSVAMGDLLLFGSVNLMFSPEVGFGDLAANPPPLIVTAADPGQPFRHVSYGFAGKHGPLNLPIAEGGATGGLGYTIHTLRAGATDTYERVLTVGGDLSAAMEPLLVELERPYAVVTGTVTDGAGDPVDRVAVAAFASPTSPAASLAVTGPDGSYRLVVAPGTYDLEAAKTGYLRGAASLEPLDEGDTATADLVLGAHGELTVDIRDADGPCPAKVTLYGIDVEANDPRFGFLLGERENMGAHRVLMASPAGDTFPVKPGRYRAAVSRGFEYDLVEQEVDIPADGSATLAVTLERLLDTPGWLAGDFHIHTARSPDGKVTPCERVAEAAAEGLDIAISTDHDAYTDYAPCIEEQGLTPFLANVRGCEVSNMGAGGHRNAYPLPIAPDWVVQNSGPQYWVSLSAHDLNEKLHAEATHPAVQINHGRSSDSYMNWIQFDPVSGTVGRTGETLTDNWDAMECSNGGSFPFDDVDLLTPAGDAALQAMADTARGDVPLWADYLSFLRMGWTISAMGTSDVHGRNEGTGYARSYVNLGTDDPTTVTEDQIRDAVLAQRVVVSNGAYLHVVTEGVEAMGAEDVVPIAGTEVELYVEAQAIPSFDLSFLYVFANGRPLYLRRDASGILAEDTDAGGGTLELALVEGDALDDVIRFATEVRHTPEADTYYHVLVRGVGSMGPLPSDGPFAYTNAIYVDVDGGGWNP